MKEHDVFNIFKTDGLSFIDYKKWIICDVMYDEVDYIREYIGGIFLLKEETKTDENISLVLQIY